jgi:hypothetical protein
VTVFADGALEYEHIDDNGDKANALVWPFCLVLL